MIDARLLSVAERCGEAPFLAKEHPVATLDDRRRDAFLSAIYAANATPNERESMERIRAAAFGALTAEDAAEISDWFADYSEDCRRGLIPFTHGVEVRLAMDHEGRVAKKTAPLPELGVVGSADHAWCEKPGEDPTIAVVLMHARDDGSTELPSADLGLAFLALAWAGFADLDRAKVGKCYHRKQGAPRYVWSPILEEADLENVWSRVRHVLSGKRAPTVGNHCEACPQRRTCSAWLAPPLQLAHDALRPFTSHRHGENLTRENAPRALRVVSAMRDALSLFEGQLRTLAKQEGGIPDGHGRIWGPRPGKKGEVFEWHRP